MAEGIITLGIGSSPGGLTWFVLLGLEPGAAVPAWDPAPCRTFDVAVEARLFAATAEPRSFAVARETRVFEMECN